jgi:hypothetical protein
MIESSRQNKSDIKASTMSHLPDWAKEDTPLMGTGDVSLQDPEKQPVEKIENEKPAEDATVAEETTATADSWSKEDETKKPKTPVKHVIKKPVRNPLLYMFHCVEFWAIVGCICLSCSQILPLFVLSIKQLGVLQTVLHVYIVIFCIMFTLVETDAPVPVLRQSQLLQTYFSRGFLYSFMALIGMEEAYSGRIEDMVHAHEEFHIAWAAVFMQVSSWLVLAVGTCYMLFGLCCLKIIRDRMAQTYRDQLRDYYRAPTV